MQETDETLSDAELIARFSAGDSAAMDRLIGRYRQTLFSWLVGMTGNRADAEDLFQDIWVKIIRNAGRFSNVSFKAWMWKIARNVLIDFRRKRRAEVSLDAVDDEDDAPMVEQLVSPDASPAQRVELDDMTRRVMRAVAGLPAVQREVFLMRTQGNLSFAEIAETMGVPLNTALGRMHDAMNKLKKALAAEEV
ncbi:MAG: sigma-70 family RNA polymerase sigma factor [Kiritimatiellae bacterium]|nr:sigma-70 family RNA polymerase sigma factor [Kiritimatiellia bacterium]